MPRKSGSTQVAHRDGRRHLPAVGHKPGPAARDQPARALLLRDAAAHGGGGPGQGRLLRPAHHPVGPEPGQRHIDGSCQSHSTGASGSRVDDLRARPAYQPRLGCAGSSGRLPSRLPPSAIPERAGTRGPGLLTDGAGGGLSSHPVRGHQVRSDCVGAEPTGALVRNDPKEAVVMASPMPRP